MDKSDCDPAYANLLVNAAFAELMALRGDEQNAAALSLINSFVPDFENDPIQSLTPAPVDKEILDANKEARVLRMDFHAATNRSEPVVIEVQVRRHLMFDERALAYAAVAYLQQLEETRNSQRGEWFKHLRKTYAIQFLGYDSNRIVGIKDLEIDDSMVKKVREHPMKDGHYMKWYVFADKFSGQEIDQLQLIQVETPRAKSLGLFPAKRDFDEKLWWMSLFNHAQKYTPELVEQLYKEGIMPEGIHTAFKRAELKRWNPTLLKKYNNDEEEMREFYAPQIAMDMLDARMEGKAEGRMEGMREMARNLLQNNVDINVVASSSGLSIDEIRSLKSR